MKTISTARMVQKKLTKGAVFYESVGQEQQAITSIYLRKSGLETPYPEFIVLTVAVDSPDTD